MAQRKSIEQPDTGRSRLASRAGELVVRQPTVRAKEVSS